MNKSFDPQKERRFRFRFVERRIMLFIGDILAEVLVLVLSLLIWGNQAQPGGFSFTFILEQVPTWFYLLPFFWFFLIIELYEIRKASSWSRTLQGVATAALIGSFLYLGVYFTSPPESLPRTAVGIFILGSFVFTLLWRLFYIRVLTSELFL